MDYLAPNLTLESTPKDAEECKYIEEVLRKDFNLYETSKESRKREEILRSLKNCVLEAVKNMYKAEDNNTEVLYLENAKATFYSFMGEPKVVEF